MPYVAMRDRENCIDRSLIREVRSGLASKASTKSASNVTALSRRSDAKPGVSGNYARDTAREGYPAMKDTEKLRNYLLDVGQLIKESALQAREEREKHRGLPAQEFYDGYVL